MELYHDVLNWWFKPNTKDRWCDKTTKYDLEIKNRFRDMIRKAEFGFYKSWANSPQGYLALIILLDQMSRRLYRDDLDKIKKNSEKALQVAVDGFKHLSDLSVYGKVFAITPFQRSDDCRVNGVGKRIVLMMIDSESCEVQKRVLIQFLRSF